jgi:uroporphyrinogen-III synthase
MLRGRGALVSTLAAYRRMPPRFDAEEQASLRAALESPASHLWSFSSSEAIDNLVEAAGSARWNGASAIATHPRIAARARRAGFTRVIEARPSFEDVVACIQSIEP